MSCKEYINKDCVACCKNISYNERIYLKLYEPHALFQFKQVKGMNVPEILLRLMCFEFLAVRDTENLGPKIMYGFAQGLVPNLF